MRSFVQNDWLQYIRNRGGIVPVGVIQNYNKQVNFQEITRQKQAHIG